MSTLSVWNLFVGGNGNDFTQMLMSNIWDYVIQWNLPCVQTFLNLWTAEMIFYSINAHASRVT